jgi:hypothetical protein
MRKAWPSFVAVSAIAASAAVILLLAGAASSASSPPVYTVHALGLPPGVTGLGALPVAFNDTGKVIETGFPAPWLYDGHSFSQLPGDPSPCLGFQPAEINSQGWVVGTLGCNGFVFRGGSTQSIGAGLVPTGVSDAGLVVGIDQGSEMAFNWNGAVVTDILGTAGAQSIKVAPNGVIAGSVQSADGTFKLFLQDSSGFSYFDLPASVDPLATLTVTGVNSGGTVVMSIDETAYQFDRTHGFNPIPEPSDGSGSFSNPMAINDSGQIVGEYNYVPDPTADQSGLFLYDHGTSVDLGVQHSSAGDLSDVVDIDGAGDILGVVCGGGNCQAAILTPPPSAVALGLGATADVSSVLVGGETGYTVSVQNPNPVAVALTSLSVTLPSALMYESGTTTGATNADPATAANVLTWSGPIAVPASGSASVHFLVAVDPAASPGTVTIDLAGSASGYTVTPAPGVAALTITGPAAGKALKLKGKVDQETVSAGKADGWTITVQNTNPKASTLVSLVVTLPPGFVYQTGSTSGLTNADPRSSGRTLTWHGLMIVPGNGQATLHFGVTAGGQDGKYGIDVSGSADVPVNPETQIAQVHVKH